MSKPVSEALISHLRAAFHDVSRWRDSVPAEHRALLLEKPVHREWARRTLIESYWRICETTPLILTAARSLDGRGDEESARFWARHAQEELGHDRVLREDVCAQFGGTEAGGAALTRFPASAPSQALLAYFSWQAERGDPHLLMVLRLFLELLFVEQLDGIERFQAILGGRELETFRVHRDHDPEHVKACGAYLDEHFEASDLPVLVWSVDFIATCLIESHAWVAAGVLRDLG